MKFATVFLMGLLVVCLATWLAPSTLQVAALGVLVSIMAALVVADLEFQSERQSQLDTLVEHVRIPIVLGAEHHLYREYERFVSGLTEIAKHPSSLFRQLATSRLTAVCEDVDDLAQGRIMFHSTETWRSAYRDILVGLTARVYYSVAWVKTSNYWDDPPGRHGMQLNFELAQRGYRIERIVILPDALWPFDDKLPSSEIRHWLDQQLDRGIVVSLVREHELGAEPELLCDFGVYGDQAVGYQQLDEQSRTVCYLLDFDPEARVKAHDRWERLVLYATDYGDLVDSGAAI